MKRISLTFIAGLICLAAWPQQVEFFKGSWKEANDRAAKEHKFIFVDAYTEWCSWCKVMDKEMFHDPAIVEILNTRFIPMQIDFEDSMGIVLGMKFRVWAYPTTLIFNSYGQLTDKFNGYTDDHGEYLDFLKKNLEIKEERVFAFDSKKLDLPYPDLYSGVFLTGKDRKRPEKNAVKEYLQTQEDLFSEINWSVLLRFTPASYQDFVVENLDQYSKLYGKKETQDFVNNVIYSNMKKSVDSSDQAYFDKALKLCDLLENPEDEKVYLKLTYSNMTKDWKGFAEALGSYIEKHGTENLMFINNNCWTLYENTDDQEILLKATEWMKMVIEKEPIWMYLDTYAALLYKAGKLDEALIWVDKAIAAGDQEGQEDISSTKELKKMIEDKK